MNKLVLSLVLALSLILSLHARAHFPGLEKSMDSETYERSGLSKLSRKNGRSSTIHTALCIG